MYHPRGSSWRKWDLHVHTPASIVQHYGGDAAWSKFIDSLEALPEEIKVVGINDYLFVDGYERVLAEKRVGRLQNLDLVLPVVELRLDKFGGSKSSLSRVNFHVIFSDEVGSDVIKSQFLAALCPKYDLFPQYAEIQASGRWSATPTRESLVELGQKIIESVPAAERAKFGTPLEEGFNNLCVSLESVEEILQRPSFRGKAITAVGKTEWWDIKWNDQSVADKKSIINKADLVFTAAKSPDDCLKSREQLESSGVNARILDCSDAHRYAGSEDKDRLGNCFTWIKSDPTFEGLRQAIFQYGERVRISSEPPIEPPLQIRRAVIDFPQKVTLKMDGVPDDFCFQSKCEVHFSPYLTCIIGGRGTGKSTLLNILHERLSPGGSKFFKRNEIGPRPHNQIADCVTIEGSIDQSGAEFLQQDEIEQFATDPARLTAAIFARLEKLDGRGILASMDASLSSARKELAEQVELLQEYYQLDDELRRAKQDLASRSQIVESFQNDEYREISASIGNVSRELQALKAWRERAEELVRDLAQVVSKHHIPPVGGTTPYEARFRKLYEAVETALAASADAAESSGAVEREQELNAQLGEFRKKLDEFLVDRGLSAENLSDVGQASERIAILNEQIPPAEARLAKLKGRIDSFTPKRNLAADYEVEVNALLGPINERLAGLGSEVRTIELSYEFDGDTHADEIYDCIHESLSAVGRQQRKDHVVQCLKQLNLGSLTTGEAFVGSIADGGKTAAALREHFTNEQNFALLKLEVERSVLDMRRHGRIRVLYDGRPIEKSSFGQRCTAAIVVLLMLGNTPIVIDEPEAHLDSKLIARYLVELIKKVKLNRQVIFATHNANFVINGDAELVYALEMDESAVTSLIGITIENLDHRERLLALEGGIEAFQMRERRYGIG
jgi:ABC-type lipoprotein export system ATPase subunit